MSGARQRRYRFAAPAQFAAGLAAGADPDAPASGAALAPHPSYADTPQRWSAAGAGAPACAPGGRLFWRAGKGDLWRLDPGEHTPAVLNGHASRHAVPRMVATRHGLWVADGAPASLRRHDPDQLHRLLTVALPGLEILDLCGDGAGGLWVLGRGAAQLLCVRIDCAGVEVARIVLTGAARPRQLAWLGAARTLLVLDGDDKLLWFSQDGGPPSRVMAIGDLRPCFSAAWLAGDGRARLVLAGTDHAAWGGGAAVLALDPHGQLLHTLDLPEAATGLAADRHGLLVTSATGLLRYPHAQGGGSASATSCAFLTPVLQSPISEDPRRWLRIDAEATLPPGTSLTLSWAASGDPGLLERAQRLAAAASVPAPRRMAQLRELLGPWSRQLVFTGADAGQAVSLAAPLFDVQAPWLWASVVLDAEPGAALPRLHSLEVLYPGVSLMEHLPQIYQAAEAQPDSVLRALVGVIETTTQDLDRRIGAMGSLIAPDSAPGPWMDQVARWLGLPWDDTLDAARKRRLLGAAERLAAGRGTRSGLEALLAALLPPGRWRVTDFTAQHGFATLGVTPLPAVLAGLPATSLALNRKAILGLGRLARPGAAVDETARLAGVIALDVEADAGERQAWEPWLAPLARAMLPLTARLLLRWRSLAGRLLDDRLHEDATLAEAPPARLGTDAVTGLARLR